MTRPQNSETTDDEELGRSRNAVLLDNSTYFSATRALAEHRLDSDAVENLANLLECIVIADHIYVAPTVAWHPEKSDALFQQDGPCSQVRLGEWPDADLADLFNEAIDASLQDVRVLDVWQSLGCSLNDAVSATQILQRWHTSAKDDPAGFVEQYSGVVFLTDPGSLATVSKLASLVSEGDTPAHHLAQFLLRTNVALALSKEYIYHPHSKRLDYVTGRLSRAQKAASELSQLLIRESESTISKVISEAQTGSLLSMFGAFNHQAHLPLVLSAVLGQASSADEILPIALHVRNERSAERYRHWTRSLMSAVDTNDVRRQAEAEGELREARDVLLSDITKMYVGRKDRIGRAAQIAASLAGQLDPVSLLGQDALTSISKGASAGLESVPRLVARVRSWRRRRNVVLLLKLAERRLQVTSAEQRLSEIFGKSVSGQSSD